MSTPLTWDEVPSCDPAEYTIGTVPERFAEVGDPWAEMDEAAGSLDGLLELAARDEAAGPARRAVAAALREAGRRGAPGPAVQAAARAGGSGTGRRQSTMPLIEVARAETKDEAMAGLERWKARHPEVWPLLEPADVLVDAMRGRSSLWYRIRLNLRHVPEAERPPQEPLEVDYDPWAGFQS